MRIDIETKINFINSFLTGTGRQNLGPVEANAMFENARLLSDSEDRLGQLLRNLLIDGQLPHAYQYGGNGSSLTIHHSSQSTSKIAIVNSISKKLKIEYKLLKQIKFQFQKFRILSNF